MTVATPTSCAYVAKRTIFRNGERTSILKRPAPGLPVHEAVLFINRYRTRGRSANTIHTVVRSLALLYRGLEARGIKLMERLGAGHFLTIPEVHRLADLAQFRAADLDAEDEAKVNATNPKVVRLEQLRMPHKSKRERRLVNVATHAIRLRHFAKYLEFLSDYVSATLPPAMAEPLDVTSKKGVEAMLSHVPKITKRDKLGARVGLSEEEQKRLVDIVRPDSPDNPWKRHYVRRRNFFILVVLLATGMRRGELLNLQIGDLGASRPTLTIKRRADSKNDKRKKQQYAKTSPREIELNPAIMRELWRFINEDRKAIPKARRVPQIFVCDEGDALSESSIDKMFEAIRSACPGLPGQLTSHVARHTWNERFSEVAEKMKLSAVVEEKARNIQQGWSEDSKMAATYTRRFTERKGREVSLALQEKLVETVIEGH